jgi:hypothetical protein
MADTSQVCPAISPSPCKAWASPKYIPPPLTFTGVNLSDNTMIPSSY